MIKQEFHLSDRNFSAKGREGLEPVSLNRRANLASHQIESIRNIVGGDNVALDDYSRVKYASGKTTEEMLELRHGIIREVADVVVHPRDKQDVQKYVAYCNGEKIPITVFSAGSSVNSAVVRSLAASLW